MTLMSLKIKVMLTMSNDIRKHRGQLMILQANTTPLLIVKTLLKGI